MTTSLRFAWFRCSRSRFLPSRPALKHPHRHPRRLPPKTRRRGRRRRRFTATLGCGLCRPRRCWRTVSGRSRGTGAARTTSRATPTSATSPGRSRWGSRDRAEIFTSFLFDTRIDRDVRPIFVPTTRSSAASSDRYPRVNRVWTGDNVGDWYVGGKMNFLSEAEQDPAGARAARRAEDPDRRRGDRDQHGEGGFLRRLHRQQGRGADGRGRRAMPATSGAASRRGSTRRAARSAGAAGSGSRRGARCASIPS